MVFVSSHADFHTRMLSLLERELRRRCPAHLRVRREASIVLGPRQTARPDLAILCAEAARRTGETAYEASDVLLAVEVIAPGPGEVDHKRKPPLYAEAGIARLWEVDRQDGRPTAWVYDLDPAATAYTLTGLYRDRLALWEPVEIDIDLTEIDAV